MLSNYMGILTLNENDENMKSLTRKRMLASVPIGGRYRIIDFILSNMVNSGIVNVGVLTQMRARSLIDHLYSGKPWDLDRKINGLFILNFATPNSNFSDVEILKNNLEFLYRSKQEYVILSPSYMVCNIDYIEAAKAHEESNADITVIYKKIDDATTHFINCDTLNIGENNKVLSVGKNIGKEDNLNISMEMFILKKSFLLNMLYECIKTGYYTNIKDYLYRNTSNFKVNSYEFTGYLECINSINTYYKTNMDLLNLKVNKDLFFNNGLIYTKVMDEAPTKFSSSSKVSNSLIANGCLIHGNIENSVISRRVSVHKGAQIKNCIIMQNCTIKEDAHLENVIIDKNVTIDEGKELLGDLEIPLVIEKKNLY